MSKMISVASGFQYSVNIGYDLNNDDKLKNFIPTKSALSLLEDILLSTNPSETERARVLIGAYGKGKSHIVLTILAMLMKRDLGLFRKTMPKISENPRLNQCVQNYYESSNKLLPVIVTGSNTSLSQAFLLALQRTLSINDLMDVMPETNYKAAVQVISRWEREFPETFLKLKNAIDMPIKSFVEALQDYNTQAYEQFEKMYPMLTAGGVFNPFLGFDVVELYEEAVKGLRSKGYTGIYVIYDEFSKFLEANIKEASVSDTKMLQDFAEKCNRSGELQMHLMLISHKEIANYIDKLPKQKVDGWRGVSERFKHVHLNNNFTQTYEIIASAIQKNSVLWNEFLNRHKEHFEGVFQRYEKHNIFADVESSQVKNMIYGCYPLHPVSTFILPRLSERIAQNERTLFTFISSSGQSTLPAFLEEYNENSFEVITPDLLYDYFEPLLKKEVYGGPIHENYVLTEVILEKLDEQSLESKIVKTLSLMYILEQFEKIQPSKDEIIGIYSISYSPEEINQAIVNLIDKEYVIYLKRSNNYLRLKQTSGVDIRQKIKDMVEVQSKRITLKETLNNSNFDNYIYPSRYNNERDIIRYFAFEFIDEDEVKDDIDWNIKGSSIKADGVIYGIIPHSEESLKRIQETIIKTSAQCDRFIFIIPKHYVEIEDIVKEYNAVSILRDNATDDKLLFDEYEVIYDDLREVINSFMRGYTRPEEYKSEYLYAGEQKIIKRKAALTELMSNICDQVYSNTPIINNEAMNKDDITSMASNSRNKIVAALLRNELEPNLGFSGSGQEVSIMRSTLIRTGIWEEHEGTPSINLKTDKTKYMAEVLSVIENFIFEARDIEYLSFSVLYERLTSPEFHIGIRKGVIPIYLAAVMHVHKHEIIISDSHTQIPISADVIAQINAKPDNFYLSYLDWNPERERYIQNLAIIFREYVVEAEIGSNSYDYVVAAMKRWYMSLPKYAKDSKKGAFDTEIPKTYQKVLRNLRQNTSGNELLFKKIPGLFNLADSMEKLCEEIEKFKIFYDNYISNIKQELIDYVKRTFVISCYEDNVEKMSLASVITDWSESLEKSVFEQLFSDGTDKCLKLFKNVTNDDDMTIVKLARLATDLRIEDWDEKTKDRFQENVLRYKETAESYQNIKTEEETITPSSEYQISFTDEAGTVVTKRFERTENTKRGKLLYNQVTAALDSMGRAITDQEKKTDIDGDFKRSLLVKGGIKMAYFDNAATTYPKPKIVYDFMDSFYRVSGGNAGRGQHEMAQTAGKLIAETRELVQKILKCPAKQVVFEPTATIALNIIIQGVLKLNVRNVYISPFEHNAVTRTLHHFAQDGLITIHELSVTQDFKFDLEKIRYQFEDIKPDFVIVSHASNTIGLVAPVEEIFSLAKRFCAFTLVDMAQTAGLIDFNVGLDVIDFAVFAGHKTLYGPTGISGFVMNPSIKLPAVLFGGTGYDSANQDMPENLPEKYEMGTINISGIAGLNASLRWIDEMSKEHLWKKEEEHRKQLLKILGEYDFLKIIGDSKEEKYVGIVSCIIDGISSDSAAGIFEQQGISIRTGLHCAPLAHRFLGTYPAGTIRFSVSYFTTKEDFDELTEALDFIEDNL